MPEGPELRRSADFLSRELVGQRITNAFVGEYGRYAFPHEPPTGFEEFFGEMRGRGAPKVTAVDVKGKFMWWQLDFEHPPATPRQADSWYLWVTYGMSGQWTKDETKHTTFGVYYGPTMSPEGTFIQPESLYFNDIRHFGTLKFVEGRKEHERKLSTLGPDMLSAPPNWSDFVLRLAKRSNKTIAETLMDQSVVSGVGNYVKAEALYLAEISPHRLVSSLKSHECTRLHAQIINVMQASYKSGGATFSTYRNPDGSKGEARQRFVVYGNKTDPMGNPVIREETKDGRTTHWVPTVQK